MAQTNLIGKNILGYTVVEKIDSGAFGTVYKVMKTNAAGQYIRALKHITIPSEKQYNSVLNSMGGDVSKADNYFLQMLNNILSEIRILNDLSEKGIQHIVRYYENDILVTDSPKRYDIFILMEYLTPLEDYIKERDFLVCDVMKLGLDILYGLRSCHDNGVIHRDIKDDNIFVSHSGEYKIGDFGVSKILKGSSKAESVKGTPNFLAPEVYLGKEGYTKSVDLYSLGIVLYRLLNYSRNPFLPRYPAQYFDRDEDVAFEKRMSGTVPELPALGGDAIGRVIIKAISNDSERFQNANAFIDALEMALNHTSPEILNQKIKFNTSSHAESIGEQKVGQYLSTLADTISEWASEDSGEDDSRNTIHKHLFESIGETPVADTTKPQSIKREPEKNKKEASAISNQKSANNFVFFVPIGIFIIGIVAYFIIIPNVYGYIASFFDWLFIDPRNIIDKFPYPNVVLPQINTIIGIKIFWWVWLLGLIISLFFVGKRLQSKPKPKAVDAIFVKKEAHLMMQDITDALKRIKIRNNNKQLDSLIYSVKILEEKLSVESDFGCGTDTVIRYENQIAGKIHFLMDAVSNMENRDLEEALKEMSTIVTEINSLLRKRRELSKK